MEYLDISVFKIYSDQRSCRLYLYLKVQLDLFCRLRLELKFKPKCFCGVFYKVRRAWSAILLKKQLYRQQ